MKRANPLAMASRTTFFALMSALVLVWFLTGCMPRGETRSVEQILSSAKENFARTPTNGVPEDSAAVLRTTVTELDGLVTMSLAGSTSLATETLKPRLDALAKSMETLVVRAGYTARPAFGELIREYQALSIIKSSDQVTPSTLQLLTARTYTLLTSELSSTKFSVVP